MRCDAMRRTGTLGLASVGDRGIANGTRVGIALVVVQARVAARLVARARQAVGAVAAELVAIAVVDAVAAAR